jgi:hypothetical protein
MIISLYRVIKNSLCTWWLQCRKLQVMFKMSPASLQTFIDTPNRVLEDCVQYSPVHIPNSFCDGHLQLINFVGIIRIHWVCTVVVRCTETFWSLCTSLIYQNHRNGLGEQIIITHTRKTSYEYIYLPPFSCKKTMYIYKNTVQKIYIYVVTQILSSERRVYIAT